MRKVIVDKTGLIINAIEIENDSKWIPPKDCIALDEITSENANIGDTYKDGIIIPKTHPAGPYA